MQRQIKLLFPPIARYAKVVALRFVATPRKLWETNVGLRPATHIMSTFVCLAILHVTEFTAGETV
jgi:hypothetical protein